MKRFFNLRNIKKLKHQNTNNYVGIKFENDNNDVSEVFEIFRKKELIIYL